MKVQDHSDDLLTLFAEQRDHRLKSMNKIIVDSGKVVKRLLVKAGRLDALVCTQSFFEDNEALIHDSSIDELFLLEPAHTRSVTGHRIHQGVMALADRPEDLNVGDLGDKILVLNGVNNAENVGAICRSALAFGVDSVVIDSNSCSPFLRRAIRVSMGSVFKLKFLHTENLQDLLNEIHGIGYSLFSASNDEGASKLRSVKFEAKTALVLGNEGDGVEKAVKKLSDTIVKIPINEEVDSLNVAVASSILLYELGGL